MYLFGNWELRLSAFLVQTLAANCDNHYLLISLISNTVIRTKLGIAVWLGFLSLESVSDNNKVDFRETAMEGIYIGSLGPQ